MNYEIIGDMKKKIRLRLSVTTYGVEDQCLVDAMRDTGQLEVEEREVASKEEQEVSVTS